MNAGTAIYEVNWIAAANNIRTAQKYQEPSTHNIHPIHLSCPRTSMTATTITTGQQLLGASSRRYPSLLSESFTKKNTTPPILTTDDNLPAAPITLNVDSTPTCLPCDYTFTSHIGLLGHIAFIPANQCPGFRSTAVALAPTVPPLQSLFGHLYLHENLP
nr:unnamed protein product [Spirometra erinaceieuropaei]